MSIINRLNYIFILRLYNLVEIVNRHFILKNLPPDLKIWWIFLKQWLHLIPKWH